MAGESSVRRRKPEPATDTPPESETAASQDEEPKRDAPKKSKKKSTKDRLDDDESTSHVLDIFRVLTFLVLAYFGLSYLISNGETYTWGVTNGSKYLKTDWWMKQLRGPIYLTPEELAGYDGSDPDKPIYLAINGSIYDVSSNARTYGPGGSYRFFSGCDAARGFVTGCFAEDRTPDMRGVEEMFLPLDDPVVDRHWTAAQLAELKKQEMAEAERKVQEGLTHWVNFFKNSPKYDFVGYVKRPEGWPGTEPKRPLCEQAAKGRKKRVIPKEGK
ncbi:hypothetical protein CHGG_10543 [Chaetomium globosum CBS 148.51]|uniref:Cytochrome b5 heme-binding domain-containing protein n=1 Tax=Chaetomium globosum (strain ATCC 6205 / CBS 148.51 / DSM 1962 / NBRC 6347 / NRRL 1970) TaxID=306901 RepID=Q2GNB1_CHAGB|nr:uncharacterized protein CHGG_10543 [Chaetomium globosum CBS 148.51]EAQ84139.1 hypothetical protein CHGG_10543 [Chaetomium globosum CBS 148.51]